MSAPILKVMGVWELGYAVAGYLLEREDVLNACFTCRAFYAAARPHIFRVMDLPEISVKNPRRNTKGRRPFHERFGTELSNYTRSIRINGYVVANKTLSSIEEKHMQWREQDMSHIDLKSQLDRLFVGIEQVLACTPRLRAFTSFDMPRSLDLMILLQRKCPHIEFIKITPLRDGHGFALFNPSQFPQRIMARRPVVDGCVFPLWNVVNTKMDPGIALHFDLPKLTVLSLCNIRYPWPGHYHIRSLVAILKGTPNLKYLELAGQPSGNTIYSQPPPPPPPPLNWVPPVPPNWVHPPGLMTGPRAHYFSLLSSICKVYEAAGGEPLKLRYLRLFRGAELLKNIQSGPERGHYLAALTDLSYLEELHLNHPDYRIAPPTATIGPRSRYLWPDSIRLITDGHLPRLRRLSLPHTDGCVWAMLSKLDRGFAARLSVQVFFQEYVPRNQTYKEYMTDWEGLGDFQGLIFSGWHTRGELTANLPPKLPRTRSLGIYMPPHTWLSWDTGLSRPTYQKAFDDYVETFPEAPEMRELWLAKASLPFVIPRPISGGVVHLISLEKLEYLARSLAEKYDKLSYVRIYESAWRIYRPPPGEDTDRSSGNKASKHAVELLPVLNGDIRFELPEAFDFNIPKVV